jgi:HlyD family secretion protein
VERNRQVVQHAEGGVVQEILVTEGDVVERGQVLIRLDPTLLQSDLNATESQLFEIVARRGRLEAERDGLETITFDPELVTLAATRPELRDLMEGQERLFEARNLSVEKEIETLQGRRKQITDQIRGIEAQQTSLREQIGFIDEELSDQQSLLDRGLAQASRVLALRREAAKLHGTVGELTAAAAEAEERISESELEILKLDTRRREEAISRLRDLQYREFELRETRNSLKETLSRMQITAPVAGVVYGLTVFAERAVIRAADPLMYIVPQDRPLVIAAEVSPINIDQVFPGQEVILRFSAFDSRTTPELTGRVMLVSADAFTDERSRASFYRAEIRLDEGEAEKLPGSLALIPGMPVEAFIRTEDRTPLAYLVKPLADYFSKAFRES